MVTKLQKWGNSQGLRISRELLQDARLDIGDEVEVSARDGALIITPARRTRGKVSLPELLAKIPKDYQPDVVDWGKPEGKEVW